MSQAPKPPTGFEALAAALRTRTAICLSIAFAGLEFLNAGVLPATLNTFKARTTDAKAITEQAKGDLAKSLRDSEAAFATEDARTKTEIARQAERYRQAEARKQDKLAKIMREMAVNSPELKAAETEIKRQTAIIDNEKAHHEQSRARADATRTAAEAEGRSIEASVVTANTRAAFIKERTEAIGDCYQRFTLNMPSGDMVLFSMSMTRPNALTTDGGSSRREAFARVRQECVPENDTPTAQIYPLGRH